MIDIVITRRCEEAEGVCSFELAAADETSLPAFEPGAHVDVHLPGGIVRQYSLCPEPSRTGRYLVAVLREPASRGGSAAMHALAEGDRLKISPPRNHFPLAPAARRTLLFAGGIGITPLLAMAEHLAANGQDFGLHYCTRSAQRAAFTERLRNGQVGQRARLHHDDGPAAQRLDLDAALGSVEAGTHVYVCGPSGFMDWMLDGARARGWPEAQLHKEYFAAPTAAPASADHAFEVMLARTGMVFAVPADRSVAEVLAAGGVEVPVSCEQGVCGTCVTRVMDGTPDHRDVFLTDEEHARNDCFTPCCSRSLSARLVLDL